MRQIHLLNFVMKNIVIFYFLIICANYNSQIKISYDVERHINGKTFSADGSLNINQKEKKSIFYLSQYKNLLKKGYEVKDNGDTIMTITNKSICHDVKGYFHDFKKSKRSLLLYDVVCESKTLINEIIKVPNWSIEQKLNKYKGWNVYTAKAKINDRNWTVLFTKDIKNMENYGPWLFIGLPGLVIFASDDKNMFTYEIKKIQKNAKFVVTQPRYSRISTFEEFVKGAIDSNKKRMIERISKEYKIPQKKVNISNSPKYETIDFIEK